MWMLWLKKLFGSRTFWIGLVVLALVLGLSWWGNQRFEAGVQAERDRVQKAVKEEESRQRDAVVEILQGEQRRQEVVHERVRIVRETVDAGLDCKLPPAAIDALGGVRDNQVRPPAPRSEVGAANRATSPSG